MTKLPWEEIKPSEEKYILEDYFEYLKRVDEWELREPPRGPYPIRQRIIIIDDREKGA